jgi:hypothetical protein
VGGHFALAGLLRILAGQVGRRRRHRPHLTAPHRAGTIAAPHRDDVITAP